MTLRRKMILMTCLVFALAIALIFVVSQTILMRRFEELEAENTEQNVQRATSALYDNFDSVTINFSSLMVEKECFSVVQDDSGGMYIRMNIDEPTYATLGVNYILFAMTPGVPPIGTGFDLETKEPIDWPPGLLEELSVDNPLTSSPEVDDREITGIILLHSSTLLVQSYPIIITTDLGPLTGRMIFARFIDSSEIEDLAGQTHLSLSLYRLDDTEIPEDFQAARSSLSSESPIVVQPLSSDVVAGYGLLNDIYGEPALILRADMPRSIYQQGQETVIWLVASLALVSLAFGLVTLALINRVFLSRLFSLSVGVNKVRHTGDPSERVPVKGTDELASLGMAINGMLATLERSQHELRQSEAKKQALVDAIPDTMFRLSKSGEVLDVREARESRRRNSTLSSSGGISVRNEPLSSKLIPYAKPHVEEALRTKEPQIFELQIPSNGSTSFYEARVAVSGEDEALVMVRDVTERKQLDEAKKKELLLKEIHHRVKNNLQVISSLLYLQSRRIQDRRVVEMFNESGNRVKSMTLIHQKLYQSKDMASVGFDEYVRDLTDALFISYGADPKVIKPIVNIDDGFVGIDTAIPCGLIINELVSNSLKYAFPEGKQGSIEISMHRTEDNLVNLTVSDDGIGLPKDLDFRNTETLGLQLVATLAEQLEGSIQLEREHGTRFTITFRDRKQPV